MCLKNLPETKSWAIQVPGGEFCIEGCSKVDRRWPGIDIFKETEDRDRL